MLEFELLELDNAPCAQWVEEIKIIGGERLRLLPEIKTLSSKNWGNNISKNKDLKNKLKKYISHLTPNVYIFLSKNGTKLDIYVGETDYISECSGRIVQQHLQNHSKVMKSFLSKWSMLLIVHGIEYEKSVKSDYRFDWNGDSCIILEYLLTEELKRYKDFNVINQANRNKSIATNKISSAYDLLSCAQVIIDYIKYSSFTKNKRFIPQYLGKLADSEINNHDSVVYNDLFEREVLTSGMVLKFSSAPMKGNGKYEAEATCAKNGINILRCRSTSNYIKSSKIKEKYPSKNLEGLTPSQACTVVVEVINAEMGHQTSSGYNGLDFWRVKRGEFSGKSLNEIFYDLSEGSA